MIAMKFTLELGIALALPSFCSFYRLLCHSY
jgi:hypothetical protein